MNAGFQSLTDRILRKTDTSVGRRTDRSVGCALLDAAAATRHRVIRLGGPHVYSGEQPQLVDDEATMLSHPVVEAARPFVPRLGVPIDPATPLVARPVGDVGDQSAADTAASGLGICEQVLQVTDVGGVRVRVGQEVRDSKELALDRGRPAVDLTVIGSRPQARSYSPLSIARS